MTLSLKAICALWISFIDVYARHKRFWQGDVLHVDGLDKERSYFLVTETGYAAADSCNVKEQFLMSFCKFDEFVNVRFDCFNTALHCRDCIALALKTDSLPPDGTEIFDGNAGCAGAMGAGEIAAKYKYFI